MPVRIAAIEVGHWHALFDAAYLRTLAHMPEVRIVGGQDPDAAMAVQRNGSLHCTTAAGNGSGGLLSGDADCGSGARHRKEM
jgi:hypothetical protein